MRTTMSPVELPSVVVPPRVEFLVTKPTQPATFTVFNPYTSAFTFQIKCTEPSLFEVHPVSGTLPAQTSRKIIVSISPAALQLYASSSIVIQQAGPLVKRQRRSQALQQQLIEQFFMVEQYDPSGHVRAIARLPVRLVREDALYANVSSNNNSTGSSSQASNATATAAPLTTSPPDSSRSAPHLQQRHAASQAEHDTSPLTSLSDEIGADAPAADPAHSSVSSDASLFASSLFLSPSISPSSLTIADLIVCTVPLGLGAFIVHWLLDPLARPHAFLADMSAVTVGWLCFAVGVLSTLAMPFATALYRTSLQNSSNRASNKR